MARIIKKGATSQSVYLEVLDSTSTTGARKTGLAYNTSGLTAYYTRNQGNATAITLATLAAANSAYSSGGFKEVDATNQPGVYRLDLPDAAVASGVDSVVVTVKGATGMVQVSSEVQLVAWDPQDAVRGGLTALPNANAEAAGGLFTRGSGAGQINQLANGQIDANTVKVSGTAQTARDLGASVLLSAGTGTGQLDVTSGVIKSNLSQILGTALTETVSGYLAAAFKKFYDVASPVLTAASVNQTGDNYARLGAPAGASVSADIAAVKTDTAAVKTDVESTGVVVAAASKTGYALTSAYDPAKTAAQAGDAMALTTSERTSVAAAIWNALTSGLTTVSSIGKLIVDNLNATISSRLASSSYTAPLDAAGTRSAVGLASANLDTQLSTISGYVDTEVAAIKAKTDKLTFDGSNNVSANAKAVNDTALTGNGSSGTPWGPA